jgi:hypothetical protein
MKTALESFLPNKANRQLFPGFVCFCVAAVGVGLGFLASALVQPWLFMVALAITVVGVAGGFVFITSRCWQMFTGRLRQ